MSTKVVAAEGEPPRKKGKGKLVMIVLPLLLVLGGAGGWFSGIIPRLLGHEEAHAEAHGEHEAAVKAELVAAKPPVFVEMPDIVANLNTGPKRAAFIKLKAKLELAKPEDQPVLTAAMPRVLDLFQGYLREMRPEELRGTASTYRLREELVARTNIAAYPAKVVSVLFTEMIVQ